MDEDSKKQFKWKFYRLTLQLNVIVLLVALAVICLFLAQIPYRFYLMIGMLVLACALSVDFAKKYRETKAWLDVHAEKDVKE
jgi:cell division protein FtsW (lipid II flippase)